MSIFKDPISASVTFSYMDEKIVILKGSAIDHLLRSCAEAPRRIAVGKVDTKLLLECFAYGFIAIDVTLEPDGQRVIHTLDAIQEKVEGDKSWSARRIRDLEGKVDGLAAELQKTLDARGEDHRRSEEQMDSIRSRAHACEHDLGLLRQEFGDERVREILKR